MRPLQEYILDNFNGKLGLKESYDEYAKAVLTMVAFTFNNLNGYFFCVKCDDFEVSLSNIGMNELIKHAHSHEADEANNITFPSPLRERVRVRVNPEGSTMTELINLLVGLGIIAFIFLIALYMIIRSYKKAAWTKCSNCTHYQFEHYISGKCHECDCENFAAEQSPEGEFS